MWKVRTNFSAVVSKQRVRLTERIGISIDCDYYPKILMKNKRESAFEGCR